MNERPTSTEERIQVLNDKLSRLECSTPDRPAPRPRIVRPTPGPKERAARRWAFWIIQGWGALVFLLIIVQGWGTTPFWQWPLIGFFVVLCGVGIYGIGAFYAQLGKGIAKSLRRAPEHRSYSDGD